MNNIQEKSIVLVPRSGGGVSIGIVSICNENVARVEYLIGPTFQGKENKNDKNEWGTKVVAIQELKPVPDNFRVSFRKR